MEIKAVLAEAINCMGRARGLNPSRSDVEASALRWELYASLQNILDATAMTVSDLGLRKPGSYADLGVQLSEAGLVGEETCDAIKLMATTRNTLAHAYRRLTVNDLDGIVKQVLPKAEHVVESLKRIAENKGLDPEHTKSVDMDVKGIAKVFERRGVALAYLFGSRARGMERLESDYDLAILFDKQKVTVMDEIELALDIAQALNVPSDKVDVVALKNADPTLKARILREGVPIYIVSNERKAEWERGAYLQVLHATDLYAVYIKRTLGRGSTAHARKRKNSSA